MTPSKLFMRCVVVWSVAVLLPTEAGDDGCDAHVGTHMPGQRQSAPTKRVVRAAVRHRRRFDIYQQSALPCSQLVRMPAQHLGDSSIGSGA
jgi:hypothetical protein